MNGRLEGAHRLALHAVAFQGNIAIGFLIASVSRENIDGHAVNRR